MAKLPYRKGTNSRPVAAYRFQGETKATPSNWINCYIYFHIIRHPAEMDGLRVLGHPWGVKRMTARLVIPPPVRRQEAS